MVAYQHFMALSHSSNSEQRGEAAHMVATAFVEHDGPADERAALYASVLGFLDDPSVKVRAALAYGLLHSELAPRIVILALIKDAPIIARAVVQHSPILLDVDLVGVAKGSDKSVVLALINRDKLSEKLIRALAARYDTDAPVALLGRDDLTIPADVLLGMVEKYADNAKVRGKLLARSDLPAYARLCLVERVKQALCGARIVKGAVAPARLDRLMRDALDSATTRMGEAQSIAGRDEYASEMFANERINTRVLLHSVVHGHVLFFADCVALLGNVQPRKVFELLEHGARTSLNALFSQCGMNAPLRNLLARLVLHARMADLSNDEAARHFVVTALIQELIIEHEGEIPESLEEAFCYLDEQNMLLARRAARGVMPGFASQVDPEKLLIQDDFERGAHTQYLENNGQLVLPAA